MLLQLPQLKQEALQQAALEGFDLTTVRVGFYGGKEGTKQHCVTIGGKQQRFFTIEEAALAKARELRAQGK